MADSKRSSVGNRVATPKVASHGPGELDAALAKAIGARIKLTLSSSSVPLEGTVFTACPITNILAINTAAARGSTLSSQHGDYHLIPVSRIQSFSVISVPGGTGSDGAAHGFENAVPSIARLDLKALKAREADAIRKMKAKDASRGKGVTKEGQDIFDAIARTLPARWHETSMVVNDAVIIHSPYRLEDCSAPKDQQNALTRVKKVLENERRKLSERNGRAAVTLDAPRKGG